ncbi:MAG: beta-ketoacyl synthase [Gammaproteobacteria bacterium]|nr:beta-ketoacyl synthase [Gammaproteobacteria bacterium]MBU1777257.1 beta-ketoacyl synthase [Gammaproteobacteria bacterium]MBU1968987.1 beta-ketoacyl synthase [Gammaproteobacteria bacterium]
MKPVHLCGSGLACALGLDMKLALETLRQGGVAPSQITLPGMLGGSFPYRAIADSQKDWNERARQLVQRVAAEAGAQQAHNGVLFIATSSFDIGAVEQGGAQMDYRAFADKVATWLGWTGPVYAISTACTSSLNALIAAHALLAAGEEEEALVLGVELDNRMTPGGFAALQLLTRSDSKPFGAQRDGLVLGEAVAALRLSAREPSPWKLLGGANVVDGSQPTGASVAAVANMYRRALAASGLTAEQIDLIKVQAAGSPGNDAAEAQGLRDAFDTVPPLVSLKAAMGHTMGASGAAEIALLTACLEHDEWPRQEREIDAQLHVSLAAAAPENARRIMATILGFGGSHASVVLERA